VKDVTTGEMSLFQGNVKSSFRIPELARSLLSAARHSPVPITVNQEKGHVITSRSTGNLQGPRRHSTDVYAFMSPDKRDVTLIANYIPLEAPDGGPNFYEFADECSTRSTSTHW